MVKNILDDHVILVGPMGTGKTLWARRQAVRAEAAAGGSLDAERQRIEWEKRRIDSDWYHRASNLSEPTSTPFRAPHHTVSVHGLRGVVHNGWRLRPGELHLAHGGVFFMDSAQEWSSHAWAEISNAIRLREVRMVFGRESDGDGCVISTPCAFRLVVVAEACPCGRSGDERAERFGSRCGCTDEQKADWAKRIAPMREVCREVPFAEWSAEVRQARAQEAAS